MYKKKKITNGIVLADVSEQELKAIYDDMYAFSSKELGFDQEKAREWAERSVRAVKASEGVLEDH